MQRFISRKELIQQIKKKKSMLCVGLDTDMQKLPIHLARNRKSVIDFNRSIIEQTQDLCVAYKLNTAFYEAMGEDGWWCMKNTVKLIPEDVFVIADAKRADVGNTAGLYARAFYEDLDANAITLSPYMGKDSITPFLEYKGKWTILLALTSNEGAKDFQTKRMKDGSLLYEKVLRTSKGWGSSHNTMYVTGATKADAFKRIRKIIPEHFLLVPGVGTQGGNMAEVMANGATNDGGLLINASRSIIYSGSGKDFASEARKEALKLQNEMQSAFIKQ